MIKNKNLLSVERVRYRYYCRIPVPVCDLPVTGTDLSLCVLHEPGHVLGGVGEPVQLLVEDVVAPEPRSQPSTAHQREEGQAAADRPRLSLLKII